MQGRVVSDGERACVAFVLIGVPTIALMGLMGWAAFQSPPAPKPTTIPIWPDGHNWHEEPDPHPFDRRAVKIWGT